MHNKRSGQTLLLARHWQVRPFDRSVAMEYFSADENMLIAVLTFALFVRTDFGFEKPSRHLFAGMYCQYHVKMTSVQLL
jgi:hypothetical protein